MTRPIFIIALLCLCASLPAVLFGSGRDLVCEAAAQGYQLQPASIPPESALTLKSLLHVIYGESRMEASTYFGATVPKIAGGMHTKEGVQRYLDRLRKTLPAIRFQTSWDILSGQPLDIDLKPTSFVFPRLVIVQTHASGLAVAYFPKQLLSERREQRYTRIFFKHGGAIPDDLLLFPEMTHQELIDVIVETELDPQHTETRGDGENDVEVRYRSFPLSRFSAAQNDDYKNLSLVSRTIGFGEVLSRRDGSDPRRHPEDAVLTVLVIVKNGKVVTAFPTHGLYSINPEFNIALHSFAIAMLQNEGALKDFQRSIKSAIANRRVIDQAIEVFTEQLLLQVIYYLNNYRERPLQFINRNLFDFYFSHADQFARAAKLNRSGLPTRVGADSILALSESSNRRWMQPINKLGRKNKEKLFTYFLLQAQEIVRMRQRTDEVVERVRQNEAKQQKRRKSRTMRN